MRGEINAHVKRDALIEVDREVGVGEPLGPIVDAAHANSGAFAKNPGIRERLQKAMEAQVPPGRSRLMPTVTVEFDETEEEWRLKISRRVAGLA